MRVKGEGSKGISLEGIGKVYSEKSEVWSEKNKAVGASRAEKRVARA